MRPLALHLSSHKLLVACAAGTAAAYGISLVLMFAGHRWLLDAHGRPMITDFLAMWSAGGLARSGFAVSAYNGHLQHSAEVAILGHNFDGYLGWPYPPFFLFVAAGLAGIDYAQAFIAWVGVTLVSYAATVSAIAKSRTAILFALAAPWTLVDLMIGQNGFLTATLIGLVLLELDERPELSGVLLGLLAYKPQFGLLFPIALVVGGHRRAFVWATATVLALVGLANLVYGNAPLAAFIHGLPQTSRTLLDHGAVGWNKLQSVYGLTRNVGLPNAMGWTVQAIVTALSAVAVAMLWRSRASRALKAAGLSVATLLATPYVFVYDLPVLAVAIAFLHRERAFDHVEYALVSAALLAIVLFALLPAPTGLFGVVMIAAVVARRVVQGDVLNDKPTVTMRGAS